VTEPRLVSAVEAAERLAETERFLAEIEWKRPVVGQDWEELAGVVDELRGAWDKP